MILHTSRCKALRPASIAALAMLVGLLWSCSVSRLIPDDQYLLDRVEVRSDDRSFNGAALDAYIRQKANSRWFSIFKVPLGAYALAGRDTTRWVNRTLKSMGEQPVIYDSVQARLSIDDLRRAMRNMGYMHADVSFATRRHGKRLTAIYTLRPGRPYHIASMERDVQDSAAARVLAHAWGRTGKAARGASATAAAQARTGARRWLRAGDRFSVDRLEEERRAVTQVMLDSGFYLFHKDFIYFTADSSRIDEGIDVTMHLTPYRTAADTALSNHPRYTIGAITYHDGNGGRPHLRRSVLEQCTRMRTGRYFNRTALQATYNRFAALGAVAYTNIGFTPNDSLRQLDCDIQVTTAKPSTISFQPEGTNTAGDLGAAASLTYENRNLFRGSERLSIELRGAFEAIRGLEGYKDENYVEYSAEVKLQFPRFIAPLLSRTFRRDSRARSELSVSWDLQNRPEFHRRVFSTAWRYQWDEPHHHSSYRLDVLNLNYVYMPWISETFKHDYLDSVSNRNAILRYNYEDLFIMRTGFGLTYNDGIDALRANVETAGNLLQGIAGLTRMRRDSEGRHTLMNIAYAQYVKFDVDFTHLFRLDEHNTVALHGALGVAYPYGNSRMLPFEKRYFSGGANSVRGWSVRELGPGRFRGRDGRIDFINHSGDMKLDLSAELRSQLFWKFNGAVFIDAGNIWTLRQYDDQPGGQFRPANLLREMAVAYGLGLRLNLDYFIVRLDLGAKAVNPAYANRREHFPLLHPDFSRDLALHFAVGLPF